MLRCAGGTVARPRGRSFLRLDPTSLWASCPGFVPSYASDGHVSSVSTQAVEGGEEAPAAEEEGEEPIIVETASYDVRIPSMNQAKNCWTKYEEFYKCSEEKGAEDPKCVSYKKAFRSLCPNEWVEMWEDLRTEGNFYGECQI